jgi:ribose 5-phosphate isomerase B
MPPKMPLSNPNPLMRKLNNMSTIKSIAIAGDHAGFTYKADVVAYLQAQGIEVRDYGTDSEASCDYPDYVHPLARAVEAGEYPLGILICGSANGVCMTANKYAGIRAAIAWEPELAALARQHNDANVVCLPARFVSLELAQQIAQTFIDTPFEGGRHQRRVDKIAIHD